MQGKKRVLTEYFSMAITARMKPILTAKETAALFGIDPKTLRQQVREGRFPVQPIPGSKPNKWRRADVVAWIRGE